MNDDAFRMNRFTLRFADAVVEAAYAEEHARKSVRPIRIVLAAAGVLVALAYLLIFSGFMVRPGGSIEKRMAVTIVIFAILDALSRQPLFLRWQQTILFAFFCLGGSRRAPSFQARTARC